MGRLIDAIALQEEYKRRHDGKRLLLIDVAPTVDAEPVRHGDWIYHPDWQADGECGYECSECGRGVEVDYAYCPHCGAKMDGKGNGNG